MLQQLYDAHGGRGLEFLTFCIDKRAREGARLHDRAPVHVSGGDGDAQSDKWFGPREGLPELYVVGRDGRIVFKEAKEMFPEDLLALARFARP